MCCYVLLEAAGTILQQSRGQNNLAKLNDEPSTFNEPLPAPAQRQHSAPYTKAETFRPLPRRTERNSIRVRHTCIHRLSSTTIIPQTQVPVGYYDIDKSSDGSLYGISQCDLDGRVVTRNLAFGVLL